MANQQYNSEGSSDEGEICDLDDFDNYEPAKGGGQIWAEVIEAEKLEEGLKLMLPKHDDAKVDKLVDRGAESFQITSVSDFNIFNKALKKELKSKEGDSLFNINDHSTAEDFGVKRGAETRPPLKARAVHKRLDQPQQKGKKRFQRFKSNDQSRPCTTQASLLENRKRRVDSSISTESLNFTNAEQSSACPNPKPKKRKRNKKRAPNLPQREDFSLMRLFAATIPTGLSANETGERIAQELGEKDATTIKFAVSAIGVDEAIQLFQSTVKTEKNGGLKIKYGSRRRTSGGVFFELLKNSDRLSDDVKREIYVFSRDYCNNKQKMPNPDEQQA